MQDADALDLLHRLDALAHDAFDVLEQLALEQRLPRAVGEHVLGLVDEPLRLGLDGGADPRGLGRDPGLLGFLLGDQHLDGLAAPRDLAVAHGDGLFLGFGGAVPWRFPPRPARPIARATSGRARWPCPSVAVSTTFSRSTSSLRRSRSRADAGLVEAAVGGDADAFDFLARGDLGLLQRLDAGDLQLLDRAPPLQPRGFHHLLALDVALLDLLLGEDLGLAHLPVGVDALRLLRGQRDDALLVGEFDRLLLVDVQHLAGPCGRDAVGLQRQFDADALTLDGVAALEFGGVEHFGAGDFQTAGITIGQDALGGDQLLLRDPRRLDRLRAP